jgi:hypothetical protein
MGPFLIVAFIVQLSVDTDLLQSFPTVAAIVTAFTYIMKAYDDLLQL